MGQIVLERDRSAPAPALALYYIIFYVITRSECCWFWEYLGECAKKETAKR